MDHGTAGTVNHIVVTGASGFVAGRIVQHLREKHPEFRITGVDVRLPPHLDHGLANVSYVQADVTSRVDIESVLADLRPHAVIHTAGISPPLAERYHRRIHDFVQRINVEGTRHVLRAAELAGVKAFVFTGSCTAVIDDFSQSYPNIDERWPLVEPGKGSSYGESKAQAETLVLRANRSTADHDGKPEFRTCALRPAVIFGEGDYQLVPSIVDCILHKNESPYRLGDGLNLWDTVYVGNVADAHVLALENLLSDRPTAAGEAFFIQNNEPVGFRDFMLQIWKEFNGHIPPYEVEIPRSLGQAVGTVLGWWTSITGKPTTISRGSVGDATAIRYASGEKARRILGYSPRVGLEEGLRRSCQEYAARLAQGKQDVSKMSIIDG